ncbi:MAG: phosphonate ABC transporter, permease protein PhnE [Geminicoccaceae bacterium]
MATMIDAATIDDLERRHPAAFKPSFWRRYGLPITGLLVVAYTIYCWWFFSIGQVLSQGNWSIAGAYLSDWVTYETRPDIELEADGAMAVVFPRFDALGKDPKPDWIETEREEVTREVSTGPSPGEDVSAKNQNSFMVQGAQGTSPDTGFMAPDAATGGDGASEPGETRTVTEEVVTRAVVRMGDAGIVTVTPEGITLERDGESVLVTIDYDEAVTPEGELPSWAEQRRPGEKVVAFFGFTGRVEVTDDEVKIRRRFFGWENFLFDANSPFWGRPLSETLGLIAFGERIDPSRSNLALAWSNILYNAEWQHLDVWTKLLQTIVMAFVGTLFAGIIAFPLSFIAARNITPSTFANQIIKRFFDFLRSVDMLIWALFFTRAFGPGPLAGMSAIFFTDTGTLGKLYAEALENIDDRQREGVKSVGASPAVVQRFGVMPQILPIFASQALYFWESNTRSATIIGAVGAGGIGLKLWEAMRTNSDWENVFYMVILILIVVFIFDHISNTLRSRLMGAQA